MRFLFAIFLLVAAVGARAAHTVKPAPAPVSVTLATNLTTGGLIVRDEILAWTNPIVVVSSAYGLRIDGTNAASAGLSSGRWIHQLAADGRGHQVYVGVPARATNWTGVVLSNSLAYHLITNQQARAVSGATLAIFSTRNLGATNFVRDTNTFILAPYQQQLTAVSPWNANGGGTNGQLGVTAFSRRHVFGAQHGFPGTNPVAFATLFGTNVYRTILTNAQVGSSDLSIGLLDADLPDAITPMRLPPSNWTNQLATLRNSGRRVPVWRMTQAGYVTPGIASVRMVLNTNASAMWVGSEFWLPNTSGDSGKTVFMAVGTNLMAVSHLHTTTTGPDYAALQASAQSVMDALSTSRGLTASNYVLQTLSLTNWPSF